MQQTLRYMSALMAATAVTIAPQQRRAVPAMLLALLTLLCVGLAHAAGLGRLNVQSRIGQPLAAEIELINAGRDDLSSLKVGLAPVAAYRAAGLTFDPALNSLRLTLERRANGTPYIRAAGTRRVSEPYLDLLVELSTPDGGIQRAYTVLLDLPDTSETVATAPAGVAPAAKLDVTPPPQREPRPQRTPKPSATEGTAVPAPVARAPAPTEKPKAEPPKPVPPPITPPPAEVPKAEPPVPAANEPAQPAELPPSPPTATAAKKAPTPPPQKAQQPTTTENSKSDTTLIGGIALVLMVVIGGWWALAAKRRRKKAGEFIAVEPTVDTADTKTAASAGGGTDVAPGSGTSTAALTAATVSNVTDMVDPIDEARVYLEHGHDESAEKLLREALSQQPGREDIQMLLLEILGKRGDKDGFNQLAGRLHKQTGGAGEHWKRVMTMGYALDPAYPLYSPAAGAAPAPSAELMDIDIDLDSTTASGTATDINLDTPAPGGNGGATDILLDDGSAGKDIDKNLMLQRTGLMPADTTTTTPLDIQFDLPPTDLPNIPATAVAADTADTKGANNDGGLDFSLDLPTIKPPPAIEAPAKPAVPAKPRIDPELLEALLHKIDLARAYREMGDKEAALEELQVVLRDGDEALQTEARELIELLNTPAGTPGSS